MIINSHDDLRNAIKQHEKWKASSGDIGKQLVIREGELKLTLSESISLRDAFLPGAVMEGIDLSRADLRYANLEDACLSGTNFARAYLSHANLAFANLRGADFSGATLHSTRFVDATLSNANLTRAALDGADFYRADLSGVTGLLDAAEYLEKHFEAIDEGILVYKQFGVYFPSPAHWTVKAGQILREVVNPRRDLSCGSGINVGSIGWIRNQGCKYIRVWRCLIEWRMVASIVVPYATDGKIRTSWLQLLEPIASSF